MHSCFGCLWMLESAALKFSSDKNPDFNSIFEMAINLASNGKLKRVSIITSKTINSQHSIFRGARTKLTEISINDWW